MEDPARIDLRIENAKGLGNTAPRPARSQRSTDGRRYEDKGISYLRARKESDFDPDSWTSAGRGDRVIRFPMVILASEISSGDNHRAGTRRIEDPAASSGSSDDDIRKKITRTNKNGSCRPPPIFGSGFSCGTDGRSLLRADGDDFSKPPCNLLAILISSPLRPDKMPASGRAGVDIGDDRRVNRASTPSLALIPCFFRHRRGRARRQRWESPTIDPIHEKTSTNENAFQGKCIHTKPCSNPNRKIDLGRRTKRDPPDGSGRRPRPITCHLRWPANLYDR